MKTKKGLIITVCLLLTTPIFAGRLLNEYKRTTLKEHTDQWLQSGTLRAGEGDGRPGIGGDTPEPKNPDSPPSPVGNAWGIAVALGLSYGVYVYGKKRKIVME
jgi:hypothetical protein